MAFDEGLAQRIREILADQLGLVEKKMFGGVDSDAGSGCIPGQAQA